MASVQTEHMVIRVLEERVGGERILFYLRGFLKMWFPGYVSTTTYCHASVAHFLLPVFAHVATMASIC